MKQYLHITSIIIQIIIYTLFLHGLIYGDQDSAREEQCRKAWPHEKSDLIPDSSIIYGELKNGFRYIIKPNTTPKSRIQLDLIVGVGALHETDQERGYAHFVEHMVFNGSTHFPPGELIKYFQSIGMEFGADSNAFTSLEQTVYTLYLPKTDEKSIADAMLVFSDYAQGGLFLEDEVERERRVILAEKSARDSVSYRSAMKKSDFIFRNTPLEGREIVGTERTIKQATSHSLKSFYHRWYQPENMTLVVVGDLQPKIVKKIITQQFSSLIIGDGVFPCTEIGEIHHQGNAGYYHREPDVSQVQVSIESYWNEKVETEGVNSRLLELNRLIGGAILQKRLELEEENKEYFFAPHVYNGHRYQRFGFATIGALTTEKDWQNTFKEIDYRLRQILQFGVNEKELESVKTELQTLYSAAIERERTKNTATIARQIAWSLKAQKVFQSAQQEYAFLEKHLPRITVKTVNDAIAELWRDRAKILSVTGDIALKSTDPITDIEEVYTTFQKNKVESYRTKPLKEFPYISFTKKPSPPVKIVELADVEATKIIYSNGINVFLKKTDFEENQVKMNLRFGSGKSTAPMDGVDMIAESVIIGSGSGLLTSMEIDQVLAETTVRYGFDITKSSFILKGESLSKDIEMLLKTLVNIYVDPGIREPIYQKKMNRYAHMYADLGTTIRGAELLYTDRFFAGESRAFGVPQWEVFRKIQFTDMYQWLSQQFKESTPELAVVGDFEIEEIIALCNGYLSPLQTQAYVPDLTHDEAIFPVGKEKEVFIDSQIDKAKIIFGWPTEDYTDISAVRRLNILALLLDERLRLEIREKLGASYSPIVFNHSSRSIPGYGVLYAKIVVTPSLIEEVGRGVRRVIDEMHRGGIDAQELNRAKLPLLSRLRDKVRTNGYWLNRVLSGASIFPEQLAWGNNLMVDYNSISSEEMTAYAKTYLNTASMASAVIVPMTKNNP